MKTRLLVATMVVMGLFVVQGAQGLPLNLLNDTITYNTGVHATPNWDNNGTWLSWNITQTGTDLWRYEYVWHTDGRDLSHIIIELTEGAVASDFSNWQFQYSGVQSGGPAFGWFTPNQGNSNPGMPGSIYGVKLDLESDTPVFGFSFETWRSPVWGDFYAKDGRYGGNDTYAYNLGFLLTDANDGLHIGVPNGRTIRIADGGLTAILLGFSVLCIAFVRSRMVVKA